MTLEEGIRILGMQEEILQFSHFTNADAWELGNIIVAEAAKRGMTSAISIRLNNGYTVFQYGFEGTSLYNQKYLDKKFKTVQMVEKSTLHFSMMLQKNEERMEDFFEDSKKYTIFGGGFPIRIEEVGVIGAIMVSDIEHVAAHDLIIKCVSKYLHIDEVPRIRTVKI